MYPGARHRALFEFCFILSLKMSSKLLNWNLWLASVLGILESHLRKTCVWKHFWWCDYKNVNYVYRFMLKATKALCFVFYHLTSCHIYEVYHQKVNFYFCWQVHKWLYSHSSCGKFLDLYHAILMFF